MAGLKYSQLMGLLFSAMALLIMALNGGHLNVRNHDVSILPVLFAYLIAGPITGASFGLLFPLMRHPLTAYFVGLVASLPFILSIVVAVLGGLWPWTARATFILVAMSLTLGGIGGIIVREVSLGPLPQR